MNRITFEGKKNCFEIIIPTADGEIILSHSRVNFNAGQIIVIPPQIKYSLECAENAPSFYIEQAVLPFKDVTVINDDKNGGIFHAAKQAEEYFYGDLKKKDLILSALGALLVSYITAFADGGDFSPVTKLVIEDITKNLSDMTYSLEDFLKKLPLNYDYVRKLFKKETGETPHGYLLRRRMELAASLFKSGISNRYSAYSVAQVAEACGFSEPLYFSRVFKKYYGVAPSEYLKK